jgi:hypothetical protein
MDICLVGIAYLMKRGVFVQSSWENLFKSDVSELKFKEKCLKEPVSLAIALGGQSSNSRFKPDGEATGQLFESATERLFFHVFIRLFTNFL